MTSIPITNRPSPELAALAARNGLAVAGARPSVMAYLRDTWKYRHFANAFSTAGVVAALGQHRLGRMWQVLTPLSNAGVYYLIFGVIIGTRGNIDNFIAYLCIGIFFFTYTSQVVMQGVVAVTKNIGLVRALQFPRATLPISATLTQLQNLFASMIVLLGIVLLTGEPIRWTWLYLIPLIAMQTIFNAGLGMLMARIGNKVVDLKQILPFVMRTWMYASGVMYPATSFAEHLPTPIAHVAMANPLVVFIEIARLALLPTTPAIMHTSTLWILGIGWAAVTGIGGFIYFWLGEQEYGRG